MKCVKILRIKHLCLMGLLLLEVPLLQARDISNFRTAVQFRYQSCTQALWGPQHIDELSFIESEQQLREQGYTDAYIAGLDHVTENLQLVERLRKDRINPFTSHIPELADLIEPHIEFIEESIRSQEFDDKKIRLNLLELLKREVQKHRRSMTYRNWFNLNFLLSILATPQLHSRFKLEMADINDLITNPSIEKTNSFFLKGWKRTSPNTIKAIEDFFKGVTYETDTEAMRRKTWEERNWYLINEFPKRVLIPTIQPLGINSISNTHGTGVHFIGLNDDLKSADGRKMYPDQFFQHDMGHIYNIINIDNLQLTKYVREKIALLPKTQGEAIRYVFYEITYERGYTLREYMAYIDEIDDERYTLLRQYEADKIAISPAFGIDRASIEEAQFTLIEILRDSPYF